MYLHYFLKYFLSSNFISLSLCNSLYLYCSSNNSVLHTDQIFFHMFYSWVLFFILLKDYFNLVLQFTNSIIPSHCAHDATFPFYVFYSTFFFKHFIFKPLVSAYSLWPFICLFVLILYYKLLQTSFMFFRMNIRLI